MYVFVHFNKLLFPEHLCPQEGAGIRRDQEGIKMSEKLSVQLGETDVETSSQHSVTNNMGAWNPATDFLM